jgi:GntR family transcriptional regulator/MocR family aminotransferase
MMVEIPVSVDLSRPTALQAQLFEQIRNLILSGKLKPGTPLPASRGLAEQLGVSRNTVLLAYERLTAEGYLQAREAVGTFVSFELPERCLAARAATPGPRAPDDLAPRKRELAFRGRAQAVVNPHRLAIDFWVGRPDAHSFPLRTWRRLLNRALVTAGSKFTEYRDPTGMLELHRAIASHVALARGIDARPEQVIVVAGCQGGLNVAARLLIQPRARAAIENPCYQGAAFLFESYGAQLVPVPVDSDGLDVDALPAGPPIQLLYVTPSHQYPMGYTLSLERRLRLLDWAARAGTTILEDDYDSDFRYRGSPLTALMGLDRHGSVIYLGTFSKSMGAGLRLGYLIVPPQLVEAARTVKALLDNGHPWLEQAAMAAFLESGSYANHLRRIRQLYRARRDCLIESLRARFGEVDLSGQDSGMHLTWHLPSDLPRASEVQQLAAVQGVGIYCLQSGAAYDFDGCAYSDSAIMLGYSSLDERQIRDGVERVAGALARGQRAAVRRPGAATAAAPPA